VKKKYVIGIGNYINNDDSIGLRVVEHIVDNNLDNDFDAIEIGNDGMQIMTYFTEQTKKIVIVDCVQMNKSPGDYLLFDVNDVESEKISGNISTHEGDMLKLIDLGKKLNYVIPPIMIFAVEPASIKAEMKLTQKLKDSIPLYSNEVIKEITK